MLATSFKLILGKLGDFAFSKLAEKTTDKAFGDFNNIKDFELILKTLHANLKLLSAKAADVEEEITNAELSGRKKRKREVEEWLEQVESIKQEVVELGSEVESEGLVMRLKDGGKAAQLNEQVEKLLQQTLNFGELVLDSRGTRGVTLVTNEMVGNDFNENLERIWKLLEGRKVSKIGIYGMGGIGKTTLAKHIHNRLVQEYEGRVFWITVSKAFTIKSLQDKLAHRLGLELSDEDEEDERAGKLETFLRQMKNSVLILDDVWEKIDMTRVGGTFSSEGCRLIITTRRLDVCRGIGCKKLIRVVKLGKDEAWKLFNETLENEKELGPQVEEIAKSMAEVCAGLPLGIITVAGSMKGETTIHTWKNALADLKDCVAGRQNDIGEVDEVFRVLRYSFDRLKRNDERASNEPNMIQNCFLYCSLYPEDYEIDRVDLVKMFISEGLLDERRSRRARVEQGHSILDKLVDVCLLESCVVPTNDKEGVKMHDLVRSMALQICKGKYMVRAGERSLKEITYDEKEWTKDVEKVSFMGCDISRIREGISPDCPKLSSLLFLGNTLLEFIPNSFFSKMQGLCTLDLTHNWQIVMLPNSVSDLTSLKALLLEGCKKLEIVPNLGKLKALKELNLSDTKIKEVPQGLEELHNLRFLSMNAKRLKKLPRGLLLKLGHLQHLNLPRDIQLEIEEIESLKQLEEFRGELKSLSDFNRFIRTHRVHATCFYSIGVNATAHTFEVHDAMKRDMGGTNNQMVLCESNLKDEKVFGQGIAYLRIRRCWNLGKCFVDDLAPQFDNPTSLKKLIIDDCEGIEWILRSDGQASQFSNTVEEIKLNVLKGLKGVVMERGEIGPSTTWQQQPLAFSALRKLRIVGCAKMRKIGLPISGFPNLEVIEIGSCGEIEEIFEEDLTTLSLPKLRRLYLSDLPRLKSVSKAPIISNSIKDIVIKKCHRLMKKFPLHFGDPTRPPSLMRIHVKRGWWESLEWDSNIHPTLPRLLHPFVTFSDLDRDVEVSEYESWDEETSEDEDWDEEISEDEEVSSPSFV